MWKNEAKSKDFIRKFHKFTNKQFRLAISWNTRKLSSLFRLKDKNLYPAWKIYYGKCQCGEDYVGETIRNTATRSSEHNNPTRKSEPAQHMKNHIEHLFDWSILCNAPSNNQIRKNHEALFIGIMKPSLNQQTNFDRLTLFRNGITWRRFINLIDRILYPIHCITLIFLLIYDIEKCELVIVKLTLVMK